MIQKRTLVGILLAVTVLSIVPIFSMAMPSISQNAQEGTELLKNPGFEGLNCAPGSEPGWCLDNWTHDVFDGTFHDNIFTPQGWVTWWRKSDGYGQPEVKTIPNVPPFTGDLPRVRSGNYALLLFTFYRLQDTGIYQVVNGLEPNSTVEFSAHAHGWSCDKNDPMGYTCGDPWNQTFQVGIAPDGNTDPFSPNIVWSTAQTAPDKYSYIGPATVQVGAGGSVCVFLRSKSKWAYKYQDAYWDDASLVSTSPGTPPTNTPPPAPPTPTPGPSPTPRPTATPRPDGATVHIVESGDTLFGIALDYNVPADQIRTLNAGSLGSNDVIVPGQELVISLPSETPVPTTLPPPPSPTPENPDAPVTEPEENNTGGAAICVLAYYDENGNSFRDDQAIEHLVPSAQFRVADDTASGTIVAQYTSDGVSEPHCFTGLAPGAYRVILEAAAGFNPSGQAEWPVAVAEGTSLDIQFGVVRGEGENPSPNESTDPATENQESDGSSDSSTAGRVVANLAKIGGILVLALAAGAAVLFVLKRRDSNDSIS
ncbi:MAG: LysM peptidoglycan-binding domain-containing protein [Chloroflexi bacterium]|nr:LysM peptidoglycan-binding domain-containing protein [Chloroflexota bacterium]